MLQCIETVGWESTDGVQTFSNAGGYISDILSLSPEECIDNPGLDFLCGIAGELIYRNLQTLSYGTHSHILIRRKIFSLTSPQNLIEFQ